MRLSETGLTVLRDAEFDDLGLLPNAPGTLGFLSDHRLVVKVGGPIVASGPRPKARIYEGSGWADRYMEDLAQLDDPGPFPLGAVWSEDPENEFWDLHEKLVATGFYPKRDNEIGEGTRIHPK